MSKRMPSLDGLRGILIAMVLAAHLAGTRGAMQSIDFPEDLGNLGVRTFFVISGFLITGLLLDEKISTGSISLKKFYMRQIFRIFPASYAYIAVIALLSWFGVITLKHDDLLCAVSYTVNTHYDRSWWLGHLWSPSVEEQFYLLWPFAMVFLQTKTAIRLAFATVFAAPMIRGLLWYFAPSQRPGIGSIFPTIADAMAVGCLLPCLRERLIGWPPYAKLFKSWAFALVPISIFVLNYPLPARLWALARISLMNIASALCIDWAVRNPHGFVGKLLNSRALAWIGVLSYSLYLWQQPFINRNSNLLINRTPLNLVLAFVAAILSYYLIEKPFLRIKMRFEVNYRSSDKMPAPQGVPISSPAQPGLTFRT
jgi:peptidoglycan/LPS O-acetylase OafA/YrhL